jgi:hypothetical protein
MSLPHPESLVTISAAALLLGVNRRTIQRWVKSGRVVLQSGRVPFSEALSNAMRRRVGRPSKGVVWKWPGFWRLNEIPAMAEAQAFLAPARLKELQKMLAIVAHWHAHHGTLADFSMAMNEVLQLTKTIEQNQKDGNVVWMEQSGRFVVRQDKA